MVKLFPHHVQF